MRTGPITRGYVALAAAAALAGATAACGAAPGAQPHAPQPSAPARQPVSVGRVQRMAFANSTSGWMAFSPPGAPGVIEIAYTDSGGTSWTRTKRFQLPNPGAWAWAPLGPGRLLVVVSSPSGTGTLNSVLTTTDHGQKWQAKPFHSAVAPGSLITATASGRAACVLVASDPGLSGVAAALYCGPDGGPWHQVATRFGDAPRGYLPGLFPNGLTLAGRQAWITGQNVSSAPDLLYASSDSGRVFQPRSLPLPLATNADAWPVVVGAGVPPALPVIAYAPSGASFVVYHQAGGGAWQPTTPLATHANAGPPGALLYSAVSPEMFFVRGQHTLYATTNGGTTWKAVSHPANAWSVMQFATANQGWAVAGRATLLRTSDGGRTWTTVPMRVYRGA